MMIMSEIYMENRRTDTILRSILDEKKTINNFLDAIFGFLKRNTDFYHVKIAKNEAIGFPEGVKESLVLNCLHKFDPKWMSKQQQQEDQQEPIAVPPASNEIEITTETTNLLNNEQIEGKPTKEFTFNQIDYKNGAVFEDYCWSQTLGELEIHIKLPKEIQHRRQIQMQMTSDSITIHAYTPENLTIIDGRLWSKYKNNDAVWTIVDGKLHISIDKAHDVWWEKCFVTEPLIDPKIIECERYLDELPEETQATIHKLRTEQMQADTTANGLPLPSTNYMKTTDNLERLKLAWDAEGSPFKGQPFNPSLVYFS